MPLLVDRALVILIGCRKLTVSLIAIPFHEINFTCMYVYSLQHAGHETRHDIAIDFRRRNTTNSALFNGRLHDLQLTLNPHESSSICDTSQQ